MAVTNATVWSVATLKPDNDSTTLQVALVLVTIAGTYAQANNSKVAAVDAAITASRRNGKTVTLVDAMLFQPAEDGGTPGLLLGAKTVAVSGSDITFEVTEGATPNVLDASTEFADATALPAFATPMGFAVSFIES